MKSLFYVFGFVIGFVGWICLAVMKKLLGEDDLKFDTDYVVRIVIDLVKFLIRALIRGLVFGFVIVLVIVLVEFFFGISINMGTPAWWGLYLCFLWISYLIERAVERMRRENNYFVLNAKQLPADKQDLEYDADK